VNTALLVLALFATLFVALAFGRYRHQRRVAEWRDLLEPGANRAADALESESALERLMADDALLAAERARHGADMVDAVRLLELALRVVEDATPSRLQRLRIMGRLVRMSMAILPLEAVPANRFRLTRVGLVARAGAVLDAIVVSPAERMAIRLRVLAIGFGLTLHVLRASAADVHHQPSADTPWDRFRAALDDWSALDQEHLRSMRVLLSAIAVELQREMVTQQT
jgi:hypothetical protein